MKLSSIITAIFVCIGLYFLIMERERLFGFAGVETAETDVEPEVQETAANDAEVSEAISVLVMKSEAQDVRSGIVLRGETNAFRLLEVRAETDGTIISQPLRKGTFVNEGQLLCELDPGTKGSALAEARARLAEAEIANKASADLVKKGFASETQAISREAALESARATVTRAEDAIANLQITAPFTGLLESDSAEFGALIQPGTLCATVIALDPIKLVGFATEQQVSRIDVGALAGARLINGDEVSGTVSFVSRSADPTTRTFRVEINVPNPSLKIRDGSTADIQIALAGVKGHLLPQSVLTLNKDGKLGIRAAVNDTAQFFAVEVIRDSAEGIWVTGLPETLDVIVLGQEYVVTGTPVAVTYREDAS